MSQRWRVALAFLLCCASLLRFVAAAAYCYSKDASVADLLSSKAPYIKLRGMMIREDLVPESCQPVQLWHLVRHGTRYPSEKDIRSFMDELPQLRARIFIGCGEKLMGCGKLCPEDMNLIYSWNISSLNENMAKTLAPEGAYEQEELASTFLILFPEILIDNFAAENYKFRYTATQRTRESALAFARGAFGSDARNIHMPEPLDPDPLLQFYKVCTKYVAEVEQNETAMEEEVRFKYGNEMHDVVRRVGERAGVLFTSYEVGIMYNACRYYTAWYPSMQSAWCSVFTKRDLKVLEYWQDLKYYYESGYGHRINYEQACRLVQDLVKTFRRRVEEGKGPRGVFYFTHLGAFLKLLARLGMIRDKTPLTHEDIRRDRVWRMSILAPFSANIAFMLSRCAGNRWAVRVSINERSAHLPGCHNKSCSWDEFLALLGQYENCDFDGICQNDPPVPLEEDDEQLDGSAVASGSLVLVVLLQPLLRLLNRET